MLQATYVEGLNDAELDHEIKTNEKNVVSYAGDQVVLKEVKQDLQQLKQEKRQRKGGASAEIIDKLIKQIEDLQARVKKLEEVQRPEQYNTSEDMSEITEAQAAEQEAEHKPEPEEKGYSPADTGMSVFNIIGKLCQYEDDDVIIVSDGQITIFDKYNLLKDVIDVHDQLASG